MSEKKHLDLNDIKQRIPHRYPMLLIDAVEDVIPGESAVGIKHVLASDPYFEGHFPGTPIMPGVLIVEAMAQTAAVLVCDKLHNGADHNDLVYFMMIEEARFRKMVVPGDTLRLVCTKDKQRGNVWRFKGKAYVGDALCAEALITAMLAPNADTSKGTG